MRNNGFNHKDAVSLKEYIETKLTMQEKALDLARAMMEKRLDSMNEFRDALKDQASRFVTRVEMEAKLDAMEKSKRDNLALGVALIGIIISVIALIIK